MTIARDRRRQRLHWCLALGLVGCTSAGLTIDAATQSASTVTLAVAGRTNQTPWVAAAGSFVAVAWGGSADGKTDVFLAVSRDGGRRFDAPIRVNVDAGEARLGGELPPRVALVPRPGREPEIVIVWTARADLTMVKAARSLDGGRTFDPPRHLSAAGAIGDRGWTALAVDATGNAHAIWLDHRRLAAEKAGQTHAQHADAVANDGTATAQLSALYISSWGRDPAANERLVTPGVCYCCKTALTFGPDGALYAAWRHVYPGSLRDMAFTVSRDGGRTFHSPVRVSEDGWKLNGCPDDGPAMVADAAGTVHIVWPTVIPGPQPEGALFYSTTKDGRSFSPRVRVPTLGSPKPSHPQVALDNDGRLIVAWDEVVQGTRIASIRAITSGLNGTLRFGEPLRLSESGPSMYPVMATASDATVVAWTAGSAGSSTIQVRRLATR